MTTLTVAQAWPDHAGHEIIYSEHGRTDYRLQTVLADENEGYVTYEGARFDRHPYSGQVDYIEIWCQDCGEGLPTEIETEGPNT